MKTLDKVWLAAIIDGEGCLSISHFQKTQQSGYLDKTRTCTSEAFVTSLSICNCSKPLIDKVVEITKTDTKVTEVRRKNHATLYRWKVSSNKDILEILDAVDKYLIAKHEQAQVMREFINKRMEGKGRYTEEQREKLIELADELSILNHFERN